MPGAAGRSGNFACVGIRIWRGMSGVAVYYTPNMPGKWYVVWVLGDFAILHGQDEEEAGGGPSNGRNSSSSVACASASS